ncbi:uncharacterized protein LOC135511385 [Oncorhynchus masou masou]|uniref:uncharacterized protein LOC135511385 n=1 Tax=Oncorhynchus masou masou TaxID=90313 RepID=UPI00318301E2
MATSTVEHCPNKERDRLWRKSTPTSGTVILIEAPPRSIGAVVLGDGKDRPRSRRPRPGIETGSVVTPQALRCSALDRCTTREAGTVLLYIENLHINHLTNLQELNVRINNFLSILLPSYAINFTDFRMMDLHANNIQTFTYGNSTSDTDVTKDCLKALEGLNVGKLLIGHFRSKVRINTSDFNFLDGLCHINFQEICLHVQQTTPPHKPKYL